MSETNVTTTRAWTSSELEAITNRLIHSQQLLSAFPDGLAAPCLLRRCAKGNQEVEALPLQGVVVVGRKGDAPFAFPGDGDLTRRHCRITVDAEQCCWIEDLNSSNGLWVNGRRVKSRWLRHGDHVHVGQQDFVFHDGRSMADVEALELEFFSTHRLT